MSTSIESVNHVGTVATPWHETALSSGRDGRVDVDPESRGMALEKLHWIPADALIEVLFPLHPLLVVHHQTADLLFVLSGLLPHPD
jgi:hypothetical protein